MARHPGILVGTAGVLPNDIPASYRKREQHASSRPLRLACAGVLEARKNMSMAITAVAACDADAVKLEIYGSGPDEELLRKLVHDVGMTDRIVFRGWTDAEKIWSETDLLLFPSLHEGAPNAVLEALGHGVPVLASDTPEHRELLPRHALLPGDDPRAWGRRLQKICRDPAHSLATMVMDQQRRVGAFRFNWDEAVRRAILR
jgi:glycosyltransferase involved in cell wall biosynthesis